MCIFDTGVLSTLNSNILEQNEYSTYKTEAENWLENANQIIEKCSNIQNIENINEHLNEMNVSDNLKVFSFCVI